MSVMARARVTVRIRAVVRFRFMIRDTLHPPPSFTCIATCLGCLQIPPPHGGVVGGLGLVALWKWVQKSRPLRGQVRILVLVFLEFCTQGRR